MADMITIQNRLGIDVVLYDSYTAEQDQNYFGTLTVLGTAKANATLTVTPLHTPVSVLIAMDSTGRPIGRYIALFSKKEMTITQADLDVMALAMRFVETITRQPDSDLAKRFSAVLNDQSGTLQVQAVDAFFQQSAEYTTCTFQAYMLALTYKARTPDPKVPAPVEQQPYSLATLCRYLGGSWPDGFPDILVTDFKCGTKAGTVFVGGHLTLSDLPLESTAIGAHLLALIPLNRVEGEFFFHYGLDLGIFGIRIVFIADDFHIPLGNGKTLVIAKPTVALDISPLFRFVVFKAYATIPFDIFGAKFDAKITMVLDNVEAEIGAVVEGDHASLPFPPVPALHLDEFGVGMGVIFTPPSVAVGLQGKFHLGSGQNTVALDDDTYALVCAFEEEPEGIPVPNPLYLAFHVPRLDFATLITLFTNQEVKLDLPVSLQDLAFQWAENPLEPVALPDGTLTEMAFGCSGFLELLTLRLYGTLAINITGIQGTFTMAPLELGSLFTLTGDGKGVSLKVDAQGNPIKNNQLPKTKAEKAAIEQAVARQFVAPGGPVLAVSTAASPYFTLSARASLFEVVHQEIEASITKNGIAFLLDYGAILHAKMQCLLQDWHNLSAQFTYGLELRVPLPTIAGFALGSLHVVALCQADLALTTSREAITLQVSGAFDFAGVTLRFGPYTENVNIAKLTDLIEAISHSLIADAASVFSPFINEAEQWVRSVKNAVIAGVTDVGKGLRDAFHKSAQEAATIMHAVGYGLNEVTSTLVHTFGVAAPQVASLLSTVFGAPPHDIAAALRQVGFGAQTVAQALSQAFGLAPKQISDILGSVGYTANEIKDAFEALGGAFATLAGELWKKLDPRHW